MEQRVTSVHWAITARRVVPTPYLAPWGTTWTPSAAVRCPPARSALQVSWFRCARSVSSCPLPSRSDKHLCFPMPCRVYYLGINSDSHARCILQVSWLGCCGTEIVSSLQQILLRERFMKMLCCFNCLSNLVFYALSTIMVISGW